VRLERERRKYVALFSGTTAYNTRIMQQTYSSRLGWGLMFAIPVFLGAFLLFQVQPLMGRFLLPWFGGTPEVWTTCMLFFQVFLLGGYAYAHLLTRINRTGAQPAIHIGLLLLAVLFLPVLPDEGLKPTTVDNPILRVLWINTLTVGLPYLLLAATSPLIQDWYSRAFPEGNPYRLYALSNAGSLLALASFPFVFEPLLSRVQTAQLWSVVFLVFGILCSACAVVGTRRFRERRDREEPASDETGKPSPLHAFLWVALAAFASVQLLAVTNKITQDIPVIPFLWVLPLSLYLLSFIICFDHERWYKRSVFVPLFMLGIVGVIYSPVLELQGANIRLLISIYSLMLFCCCMVCHGELYRLRPKAKYLTGYYLMVASGGALGGFFVAVVGPLVFETYVELHLGLLGCALALWLAQLEPSPARFKRKAYTAAAVFALGVIAIPSIGKRGDADQRVLEDTRNFFGVLTLWEEAWEDPGAHALLMQHGTTFHGLQFQSPEKEDLATAYYSPGSGIGVLLRQMPKQSGRRIGLVGLGVGTIATYGNETDVIRFYEINPEVERMARQYFTYLERSDADVEVVLGDARLSMEYEEPQNYDVLVLDAFSSDAVPVHLLTLEAMEVYLRHLAPDGVLAFHISSWHLDLHSVVWRLARELDLETAWIETTADEETGAMASDWILLATNDSVLGIESIQSISTTPYTTRSDIALWTDDHVNLLEILKGNLLRTPP